LRKGGNPGLVFEGYMKDNMLKPKTWNQSTVIEPIKIEKRKEKGKRMEKRMEKEKERKRKKRRDDLP